MRAPILLLAAAAAQGTPAATAGAAPRSDSRPDGGESPRQLTETPGPCAFVIDGPDTHHPHYGPFYESSEMVNSKPLYVHMTDPLKVIQWSGSAWDWRMRDVPSGPGTSNRAGNKATLDYGAVFTWGNFDIDISVCPSTTTTSTTMTEPKECAFVIYGPGDTNTHWGTFYRSPEEVNGKELYVLQTNILRVIQWSGTAWDFKSRTTVPGPGSGNRAGVMSVLEPGPVYTWNNFDISLAWCPTTTTSTTETQSSSTLSTPTGTTVTTATLTGTTLTTATLTGTSTTLTGTTSTSRTATGTSTTATGTSTESSTTTASSTSSSTWTSTTLSSTFTTSTSRTTSTSSSLTTSTSTATSTTTTVTSTASSTSTTTSSSSSTFSTVTSTTTSTATTTRTSTTSSSSTTFSTTTTSSTSTTSRSSTTSTSATRTSTSATSTSTSATSTHSTTGTTATATMTVVRTTTTTSGPAAASTIGPGDASATTGTEAALSRGGSTSTATTTTPVPAITAAPKSPQKEAEVLLDAVEKQTGSLLAQLAESNDTVTSAALPGGGTVAVFRLGNLVPTANSSEGGAKPKRVRMPTPTDVEMEVSVPVSLLQELVQTDKPVVFVVSQPDAATAQAALSGSSSATRGKQEIRTSVEVLSVAVMDVLLLGGGRLAVEGLAEAIEFSLPANFTPGMECAYWDETLHEWSTRGVTVSGKSVEGSHISCETRHLSLFGAIVRGFVQTILCANFDLFNSDSFDSLFRSHWVHGFGARLCWVLLAFVAALFLGAWYLDWKRSRDMCWVDEFFLVETCLKPPAEDLEAGPAQSVRSNKSTGSDNKQVMTPLTPLTPIVKNIRTSVAEKTSQTYHCLCGPFVEWVKSSSAVREAVDDILSHWFSYFAEFRSALEGVCEGLHHGAGGARQMSKCGLAMTTSLLLVSARRLASSGMGMSEGLVLFVMHDEDLHDFLMEDYNGTAAERERSGDAATAEPSAAAGPRPSHTSRKGKWKGAAGQRAAWSMLHNEVTHHLVMQTNHLLKHGILRAICDLFRHANPISSAFTLDIFQTCKQRVLLIAVDIFGAFALSCLFFQASGLVRGKPLAGGSSCDDGTGHVGERVGRFLFIALGSVIVAGIPVMVIESFQTRGFKKLDYRGSPAWRRQLQAWKVQDRLFWGSGLLVLGFQVTYVLLFLANIGSEDDQDWSMAGLLAVLQDFLAIPLLAALVLPGMALVALFVQSRASGNTMGSIVRHAVHQLHRDTNVMLPVTRA